MDKLANIIASTVVAIHNCEDSNNELWLQRHTARLELLIDTQMPRGSGWDCGTKIDIARSNAMRLVFTGSFHHMDEQGCYDGWTEHTVTVRASFLGFHITIGGKDRNDVKDYLADLFETALSSELTRDFINDMYTKRGL